MRLLKRMMEQKSVCRLSEKNMSMAILRFITCCSKLQHVNQKIRHTLQNGVLNDASITQIRLDPQYMFLSSRNVLEMLGLRVCKMYLPPLLPRLITRSE